MADSRPGGNPNDESFWTTNPGMKRSGGGNFYDKLFRRIGIKFPFVEAKPLSGINRWVIRWRLDPSPAGWIMSQFMSGTTKTIERYCREKNAELERAHRARMKRRRDAEKAREIAERRAKRVKRDEDHVAGAQDGTHTSGPWWACPTCNPKRSRLWKPEDDE